MSRKVVLLAVLGLLAIVAVAVCRNLWQPQRVDESAVSGTIGIPEGDPAESGAPDTEQFIKREVNWLGADGEPFALQEVDQLIDFLSSAKVLSAKRLDEGINRISKVLLERDGLRLHGAFRDVDVFHQKATLEDGTIKLGFQDDCDYEIAAFRLSRMLGLDNVPPTVPRKINGKRGSLQVWVEKAMTEKQRVAGKHKSPHQQDWNYQVHTMRLFDQLISNEDRNQGNILIDSTWKLWMIDHTRAFRRNKEPVTPQIILYCQRSVWERLQTLDPERLKAEMKGVLLGEQIKSILLRRDKLVKYLKDLINREGEEKVLFG